MSTRNFIEAGLFLPVRMKKRGSGEILIQQNQLRVNSCAVIGKMKVDKCWEREKARVVRGDFHTWGFLMLLLQVPTLPR
jgi:hypothetical protein